MTPWVHGLSATDEKISIFYYWNTNLLMKGFEQNAFLGISYTYDENGHIGYRTSLTDTSGEAHWTYDLRGGMIEEAKTIDDRGTYITQWR